MQIHAVEFCGKYSICAFALKSSQAISCVTDKLKPNILEISVSLIRANVMNDHTFLIYIPAKDNASPYWHGKQQEGGIIV
jgi:hypothetical protein